MNNISTTPTLNEAARAFVKAENAYEAALSIFFNTTETNVPSHTQERAKRTLDTLRKLYNKAWENLRAHKEHKTMLVEALEQLKQAVGELLEAEEDSQISDNSNGTIRLGLYGLSVREAFEKCKKEEDARYE